MPKAFSFSHGLDWNTEVSSFWAWFQDAHDVVLGKEKPHSLVHELVGAQRDKIEEFSRAEQDPSSARLMLTTAVALVGFHYASMQKLLEGLDAAGLFEPRALSTFDTIVQPTLEE